MKKPLISIITVVFNAAETLENTILSVSQQSFNNYEYIIIDGKSTDESINIIENYKKDIDFFISEPDDGIYDAMNKGMSYAKGDWILFLGADDILYDIDILQKISSHLIDDKIYYGDVQFKSNKQIYNGPYNKFKICLSNIPHQAIFYPKSIYKNYKFDIKYNIYADYFYNLKLFAKNSARFKYFPIIVSIFNDSGASSFTKDWRFEKDFDTFIKSKFGIIIFLFSYCVRKTYLIKHNIF